MRIRTLLRKIIVFAAIILVSSVCEKAYSQTPIEASVAATDTIEILSSIKLNSGGDIKVDIPESLLQLIEKVKVTPKEKSVGNSGRKRIVTTNGPVQVSGFRIQIFADGRDQRTLEARAKARSRSVVAKFPKYRNQVYSFSKAPNWFTRIGNFKTREEANSALSELKSAFPGFAGEMRVVKSNIVVVE